MFSKSGKIFNVYEKPEASEPTERVVLLREGFSVWAFLFHFFWLIANRLWQVALGYVAVLVTWRMVGHAMDLSLLSIGIVQFGLQLALGFHAYDLQGWTLKRRGYRHAGILAAESELAAERRYFEFAA